MWLAVALLAQLILGTSAVFDKLLLRRGFFDPWVYTFWIGVFGLTAFVLAPFGLGVLPFWPALLALGTGAIFIIALFLLFFALARGEASTVLPFIGAVSPVATLALGGLLLKSGLAGNDLVGFLLLLIGGFTLFAIEKKEFRVLILGSALLSAVLFGLYGVLAKIVFEETSFITGFIAIKSGAALLVVVLLLIPHLRKKVLRLSAESSGGERGLYVANTVYAGVGSALVNVAISLAHPALVDATQSFKYVVIFFAAWLWLRERFEGKILWGKITATVFVLAGLVWLAFSQ